jgi:hypothetical protein
LSPIGKQFNLYHGAFTQRSNSCLKWIDRIADEYNCASDTEVLTFTSGDRDHEATGSSNLGEIHNDFHRSGQFATKRAVALGCSGVSRHVGIA